MSFRIRVAVVALTALGAAVPTAQAATHRLVAFQSCPALLTYAKTQARPFVSAYGFGPGPVMFKSATPGAAVTGSAAADSARASAPTEGVDYSGTNVQETGVDEPDMVKTNGDTLFAAEGNQIEAVDVTGKAPKLLDTLKLTGNSWDNQLLLSGNRLLVLSRGGYWIEPMPAMAARMIAPASSTSTLTEIDVSDPSNLKITKTMTLDGAYVDARMIGSTVRIVSSSQLPVELPYVSPTQTLSASAAKTKNQAIIANSRVKAWLPTYRLGKHGAEHALVQCRDVRRPIGFSGLGMLAVTTIDLSKGLAPIDTTGLMTDGRIVYASQTTLFVATERWNYRPDPEHPEQQIANASTELHGFDISDKTKTTYLGSGSVPGYLLSQWSLSEFQGVLRVVSTDTPSWWGGSTDSSQTFVTTMRPSGGKLNQVGQLGGLGQGERVYAVRFIGNDAFVVTFHQVDPLHTLDLSDPAHPTLLGTLTIPGYSAYLHPIGDNLLLGIGQDIGAHNEPSGTQISLFDITDLKHPTRLQHASLGQGWSSAESDHHAFLYWPQTALVVVPFGQQAVGMKVSRANGISELGRIAQLESNQSSLPEIQRALVVRDTLLTVSPSGVKSVGLSSFANLGWAAFPTPDYGQPIPIEPGAATVRK